MLSEEERERIKEEVIEALKESYDPEIPVDVYNLGLVYGVEVDEEGVVRVRMTLTNPACPAAGMVALSTKANVRERVKKAKDVIIDLVWDPPWTPAKVTEKGREMLKRIYGYDVIGEWLERYT